MAEGDMIIKRIEVTAEHVTIFTALPGPEAGLSKAELLATFARELRANAWQFAREVLGKVVRLNGRMTTEMALAAGVVAARLGAAGVELYDPAGGGYVPVTGNAGPLAMPVPVLPGMLVEVAGDGGLFRRGATAVVLNVGRDQVNIAEEFPARGRGRRDTGWTAMSNVRPVGWDVAPEV